MPTDNATHKKNRLRQYNDIIQNGVVVESPCEYYFSRGLDCVIDLKSRNCTECTRRGRKCSQRFHSNREWDRLERKHQKLANDLKDAKKRWLKYSQKMQTEMSTILRLETQQKWLRKRNDRMRAHNSSVLKQLNKDNPLGPKDLAELDRLADAENARILAATSEDPTLTQIIADADPASSSFWDGLDVSLLGDPSGSNGTVEPAGGSPSGSR
ncbi:hypothetical protein PENSTE_c022G01624 [Penicillium steckii]|uniref:Uncharacterized protein n=1 Tax=Penicillium steckii TaxID=303698 RepID=A0A1V6SSG5_9EURO|nr:hypothetical protein PENSTE_c022G01624 [Penicillium steckii]